MQNVAGLHNEFELISKEANRRGLQARNVLGDGNCQPRAVALGWNDLKPTNPPEDHISVRKQVAKFLGENLDTVLDADGSTLTCCIPKHLLDSFAERQARPGYWLGHLALVAIATVKRCCIKLLIVNKDGTISTKIIQPFLGVGEEVPDDTIYMGYLGGSHYISLTPKRARAPSPAPRPPPQPRAQAADAAAAPHGGASQSSTEQETAAARKVLCTLLEKTLALEKSIAEAELAERAMDAQMDLGEVAATDTPAAAAAAADGDAGGVAARQPPKANSTEEVTGGATQRRVDEQRDRRKNDRRALQEKARQMGSPEAPPAAVQEQDLTVALHTASELSSMVTNLQAEKRALEDRRNARLAAQQAKKEQQAELAEERQAELERASALNDAKAQKTKQDRERDEREVAERAKEE